MIVETGSVVNKTISLPDHLLGFALFFVVIFLSLFSHILAGLVWWNSGLVFLIYMARDVWVLAAFPIAFVLLSKNRSIPIAALFLFGVLHFFFSVLVNIHDINSTLAFVQFRNTFGFFSAWLLTGLYIPVVNQALVKRILMFLIFVLVLYCASEIFLMLAYGYELSDKVFSKTLLEGVKGVKANVDAGLFGAHRIGGPLFSPSQLGIYVGYLYFTCRIVFGRKAFLLGAMLIVIEVFAVSKTGMAMVLLSEFMLRFGRRSAVIVVISLVFAPILFSYVAPVISRYHAASMSYHFQGYISGLKNLFEFPFGVGVGSAGTLASVLTDSDLKFGQESGLATILGNIGFTGIFILVGLFVSFYRMKDGLFVKIYTLYIASMLFNENALSPYLYVTFVLLLFHWEKDLVIRSRSASAPCLTLGVAKGVAR